MYKITKLNFTETDGITCLEVTDDKGVAREIISKNKQLSDANEGNFIDLPEITAETLIMSGSPKTKAKTKPSAADTLRDFCSRKKTEPGINLKCLTKFYEFYIKKAGTWKGEFRAADLYDKWEKTER